MKIYLLGYVTNYNVKSPHTASQSVFSLYPPKKGWRYINYVVKDQYRAPAGTELTPILSDGAIPVYAVDCGTHLMVSIHAPKSGEPFFKTYIKLPEGVMLVENEGE